MRKTSKDMKVEVLKKNGINTDGFFSLNLSNIPNGTPVTVDINGIKYNLTPVQADSVEDKVINAGNKTVKNLINNGYVFNRRTDGRFVTAETFRMLNWTRTYREKNCALKTICGWDACLKTEYSYMYQFEMMKDELEKLFKMKRDNDPEFERLSVFFTPEVVIATCEDYMKKLRKYINNKLYYNGKLPKCKGRPYIKLTGYDNVFTNEIYTRIYMPLEALLKVMKRAALEYSTHNDYFSFSYFYDKYKNFISYKAFIKLPHETKKSSVWKDAFKAKGAYVTLLNIVKFHGVTWNGLNTYQCVSLIEKLRKNEYKNELWRFHLLLKEVIKTNNFDLKYSISRQTLLI